MECKSKSILIELGKKWNLLIIRQLEMDKVLRFNELTKELKITPKVLDARLKELTALGIVDSKRYAQTPPRVEYTLTKKGLELIDSFKKLDTWVEKYHHTS